MSIDRFHAAADRSRKKGQSVAPWRTAIAARASPLTPCRKGGRQPSPDIAGDPSTDRRTSTEAAATRASQCSRRDGNRPPYRPRRLARVPPSRSAPRDPHSSGTGGSNASPEPGTAQPAPSPPVQPVIPRTRWRNHGETAQCSAPFFPAARRLPDGYFSILDAIGFGVGRDRCQSAADAARIHISPPFPAAGTHPGRLRAAGTGHAVEGSRVQQAATPAGTPQAWPSPLGSGSAAGFPAASPLPVSAPIHSRNARTSGLSPDPGATAMK